MAIDVRVHRDPDYLLVVYSGIVSVADVDSLISGMERGDFPPNFNLLHDFRAADAMEFPDQTATGMSFRRRETLKKNDRQVHAAVLGASEDIVEALRVWRATFQGDADFYVMRICDSEDMAMEWVGAQTASSLAAQ